MKNGIPDKAKIDLHVHPYLENYSLQDLISAAEKKGINILGLERYKEDVFPEISKKARQLPKDEYDARRDNGTCITVYNKETKKTSYILRATEIMTGDIAEPWVVQKAMEGADEVYLLSAMKHVGLAEIDTHSCIKTNIVGAMNVIEESIVTSPKVLVFISI